MTAVIWTDVVQMFLYVGGAILSFFVILRQIPGGWDHVVAVAGPLGKFHVFDFGFAATSEFFTRPYSFWAGFLGGCFPDDGQPRHRAIDGAAAARGPQRAREPAGAVRRVGS